MSQQEEMKNLTLLTLSNSTVQNLRHFVLLLANLILQVSIFLIFQTSSALSLNL